jgi:hypothetical protein
MRNIQIITFAALALMGLARDVAGQIREFPYEARVVVEEALVRSGGGDAFYPTQRVAKETVVNVYRHDPGGWYVIDPPEGSFSWIPERFVNRLSESEGEVQEDNVIAFVGSEFGDESSVFQRRMKKGEKVTILGQKDIDTTSGMQSMLKIKPPQRERRWIPGAALVPVDALKRQQQNSDPYAVPPNAKRPDVTIATPEQAQNAISGGVTDVPVIGPSDQLARLQLERSEKQKLAEIDRRFREMVLQDAGTWDLDSIETEYRGLQNSVSNRQVAGSIDMRFPAIERYRRRLAQINDLRQVQFETDMKDAQLAARMGAAPLPGGVVASPGPQGALVAADPPQVASEFEAFLNRETQNIAQAEGATSPSPLAPIPDIASMSAAPTGPSEAAAGSPGPVANAAPGTEPGVMTPGSPNNRFIGAGIVQRAPGTGDTYVLMTPSGRILADLKATGNVQLERYIGQQVGVQGSRWSEKEKRDMIEVSGLEPVRIRR